MFKKLRKTVAQLSEIASRPHSVFVGNNRILTKVRTNGKEFFFYCQADDKLITPSFVTTGLYDGKSTNFVFDTVKPDFRCIDVGTNMGYFTCLLARLCPSGTVIGIEPDEAVMALARDNVLINSLHEVAQVRHAAANDTGADMTLYRRVGRSGNTSMTDLAADFTEFMAEPPVEPFTVTGLRVDDLVAEFDGRLDFLKVDVEGAEPLVFEGAREAIARNPQIAVLMEWSPGQMIGAGFDPAVFLKNLEGMGLRPFSLDKRTPEPISFSALAALPYDSGVAFRRV